MCDSVRLLYLLTYCGMQGNALYNDCGGERVSFPQRTIYDAMREHNVSFGMFLNSTCGLDGKPCHGEDPITPDSPSAINTPDVAMEVALPLTLPPYPTSIPLTLPLTLPPYP